MAIYLVNGIKLQGQVESFDQFVVLLKNTVSQVVYKHAISTIVPARNVKLTTATNGQISGTVTGGVVNNMQQNGHVGMGGNDLLGSDGGFAPDSQNYEHNYNNN